MNLGWLMSSRGGHAVLLDEILGIILEGNPGNACCLVRYQGSCKENSWLSKTFFLITQLTASQCPIGPHHILCLLQAHIPPLWENGAIVVIEEQLDGVVFFLTVIIWIFIVGWFFTLVQEEKW